MNIGLRIDVDTFRGTKVGVPNLLRVLGRHGVRASFFFTVGPDNMGRHLWRLCRPAFAWKMLRTRAPSLYGWDILLRGTLWPGPVIGARLADVIRAADRAGHEIGLHAWDHHRWQMRIDTMSETEIRDDLRRGVELLGELLGRSPTCSAVPGWRCDERVLLAKEAFSFRYNSDCRGTRVFRPLLDSQPLNTPQIPIDLPTYDEVVGTDGVSPAGFNRHLLSLLRPDRLNALTIHAEVEGISCLEMFEAFLTEAEARGWAFVPLGSLLDLHPTCAFDHLTRRTIPGREGWVACQQVN